MDTETRAATARNLARIAMDSLILELGTIGQAKLAVPDDRNHESFLGTLESEHRRLSHLGLWPVPAFEEFSPERPVPRSPELVEAMSYFTQSGRPALIRERKADGKRTGWLAELLVFCPPTCPCSKDRD